MSAMPLCPDRPLKSPIFRLRAPARSDAVAPLLDQVALALVRLSVAQDLREDVTIALGEVLNNVVEHACAGIDGAEIVLAGCRRAGDLRIVVADPGRAFSDEVLPPGNPVDLSLPLAELPEGGFGWFMIRALTREVAYCREDGVNRLTLVFSDRGGAHP